MEHNGFKLVSQRGSRDRVKFDLRHDSVRFVDTIDPLKSDARARFVTKASQKMDIDREALSWLDDELLSQAETLERKEAASHTAVHSVAEEATRKLEAMPNGVKEAAVKMLEGNDIEDQIVHDIEAMGLSGEATNSALTYLVATSRLLPEPASLIVQGSSSSGKSHILETIAKLIPPEGKIEASSMTANALYYTATDELVHRVIFAGERSRRQDDESADNTRALREMISAGKLSKMLSVKDPTHGFVTRRIEREGPIAFLESTTLQHIFEEDRNRCLIVHPNESVDQSRDIIRKQAQRLAGAVANANKEFLVQKHFAIQRMLAMERVEIILPQAIEVAERISCGRVEIRRAFSLLMAVAQAVALLRHRHRKRDDEKRIVGEKSDIDLALLLCRESLAEVLGDKPPEEAVRFYKRLDHVMSAGAEFTIPLLVKELSDLGRETIRARVDTLTSIGSVDVIEPARGSKPAAYRLGPPPQQRADLGL